MIKTSLLKRLGEGIAYTGLGFIANGCGNNINSGGLPANNIDFGRHMEVFEEDLQLGLNNSLDFVVESCANRNVPSVYVETIEDKEGREAPFDADVSCVRKDNGYQDCKLTLSDNNREDYISGEMWTVRVASDCGVYTKQRVAYVTFLEGRSNDSLDDHVDDLEDRVDGFYSGDGVCEEDQGENSFNSPDCEMPLEDLLGRSYVELTDMGGNPVDPLSMNGASATYQARFVMPKELEDQVGAPTRLTMRELGYTGAGDCFGIDSYSLPTRLGEQNGMVTYAAQFSISRTASCDQNHELIEAQYDLGLGNGNVSFYDSAEAH